VYKFLKYNDKVGILFCKRQHFLYINIGGALEMTFRATPVTVQSAGAAAKCFAYLYYS